MNDRLPNPKPDSGAAPQASASGDPPRRPPKLAVGTCDEFPDRSFIDIPDPIILHELALALNTKPFRIITDAMELGHFQSINSEIGFALAEQISKIHGVTVRRKC